jgi:hypothetical protein
MTTEMIRKQIYIHRRQQKLLKNLAKQRGVSEAELIRRALDREMALDAPIFLRDSHNALQEILQAAFDRRKLTSTGEPYHFNRNEIYEERETRWLRED